MLVESTVQFEVMLKKVGYIPRYEFYRVFENTVEKEDIIILYQILWREKEVQGSNMSHYIPYIKRHCPKNLMKAKQWLEILLKVLKLYPDKIIQAHEIPMYYYRETMKENKFSGAVTTKYEAYGKEYLGNDLNLAEQYMNILINYLKMKGTSGKVETPSEYYQQLIGYKLTHISHKKNDIENEVIACALVELCSKHKSIFSVNTLKNQAPDVAMTAINMIIESDEDIQTYLNLKLDHEKLKILRRELKRKSMKTKLYIDLEQILKGRIKLPQHVYDVL